MPIRPIGGRFQSSAKVACNSAACWQASLSAVCSLVRDAPSHETVRQALLANLPGRPLDLRRRLLAALHDTLPEHLWASAQPMALDLHQRPYYGRRTRGCTCKRRWSSGSAPTCSALASLSPPTAPGTASSVRS